MTRPVLTSSAVRLTDPHDRLLAACEPLTFLPGETVALVSENPHAPRYLACCLTGNNPGCGTGGGRLTGTINRNGLHLWLDEDAALLACHSLADQVSLLLGHHLGLKGDGCLAAFSSACKSVGLQDIERHWTKTTEQLDESYRWRALIAMAIACRPALLALAFPPLLDLTLKSEVMQRLRLWAQTSGACLLLAGPPMLTSFADRSVLVAGASDDAVAGTNDLPDKPALPDRRPKPADRLEVRNLSLTLELGGGPNRQLTLPMLSDVSFSLEAGHRLALIGESGGGKAMLARALIGLFPHASGTIRWRGEEVVAGRDRTVTQRQRQEIRFLYPEPVSTLNPALSIGQQLSLTARQAGEFVSELPEIPTLLTECGLPEVILDFFAAELDPDLAARIALVRALLSDVRLLICDDPAASLQGRQRTDFLRLLQDVARRRKLSLILATDRIDEAAGLTDQAMILLGGRVVEKAAIGDLIATPRHPYSQALIRAAGGEIGESMTGIAPLPAGRSAPVPQGRNTPAAGCRLSPSCPMARPFCAESPPPLEEIAPGHWLACHYWDCH